MLYLQAQLPLAIHVKAHALQAVSALTQCPGDLWAGGQAVVVQRHATFDVNHGVINRFALCVLDRKSVV